jgi:hypothetical protein
MSVPGYLPPSDSTYLGLDHPTYEECNKIWTSTAASWKDSLDLSTYLIESHFLTTVPLAADGGMTTWILVDKRLTPNHRPIFCSCESFRKRSLTSDTAGNLEENIVHGIASVFCPPEYRGKGYGARHMREVAEVLRTWQSGYGRPIGSILYSDIGKEYYHKLGWAPNTTNSQLVFTPHDMEWPTLAHPVLEADLPALCNKDEQIVRTAMKTPTEAAGLRMTILPDLEHMLWHIRKEDFAANYIFGAIPQVKGAIAGPPDRQVWAIWTHRWYHHPCQSPGDNVLYILRLVVEGDKTANKPHDVGTPNAFPAMSAEQAAAIKAVLVAARNEAAKWKLDSIQLWEPSPLVRQTVLQEKLEHLSVEREETSITSGFWYLTKEDLKGEGGVLWVNNEHYAWC